MVKKKIKSKTPTKEVEKQYVGRREVIGPQHVGKSYLVHNGKTKLVLDVTEEHVSFRFGEFFETRKRPVHKQQTKKNKRVVSKKK